VGGWTSLARRSRRWADRRAGLPVVAAQASRTATEHTLPTGLTTDGIGHTDAGRWGTGRLCLVGMPADRLRLWGRDLSRPRSALDAKLGAPRPLRSSGTPGGSTTAGSRLEHHCADRDSSRRATRASAARRSPVSALAGPLQRGLAWTGVSESRHSPYPGRLAG
jgi:hypothetical protein